MKPSKDENEVASRVKATTKYAYVAPGAVGKGRGRGLKSMLSLGVSRTDIPFSPSTNHVMQYNQFTETSVVAKGRGKGLRSMSNARGNLCNTSKQIDQVLKGSLKGLNLCAQLKILKMRSDLSIKMLVMLVKFLASEKEHKQANVPISLSTDDVMESTPTFETSFSQGWRTTDKTALAHEKESLHSDIPISPIEQVKQSAQTAETSSCATGMDKKVRGSNKCKEVALLDIGQKLKVTFYNNRTVGKNSNLFSRHLGKIVRDRNICPLGVSSWKHIKEEKLNHMWAVVKDKFDSDDMNSHRDHVLGWMKELWNKWRGQLHANYGGKDGNPPDLATIFYETRKKNNTLVDSKTIEKHAQIQELVESEPSLSSIEIVEKCFGPQSRSHVFGFGGGVKARDLKGGASSKPELLAELRSTQKENQSLKHCISNFQNEMKELKQLKEIFLAQHPNFQPPIQENDYLDT
ncbi:hypothetical protein KY284_010487 [Solanum tuberosum]|nr:hypothetical protein KY284_010487 [Solanum tuberosum]